MKQTISLRFVALFGILSLLAISNPALARTSDGYHERIKHRIEQRQAYVEQRLEMIKDRFGHQDDDHDDDSGHGDGDGDGDHGGGHDGGDDNDGGHGDGDHGDDDGHGGGHGEPIEAEPPIPTIDLVVHEDPKSGYNLQIITENYEFAPQNASTEHVNGEGHAHLYIDGEKITRIYGNWFYIPAFEDAGHHTVRVELSSNNHSAYAHDGDIIDDTEMIMVE